MNSFEETVVELTAHQRALLYDELLAMRQRFEERGEQDGVEAAKKLLDLLHLP